MSLGRHPRARHAALFSAISQESRLPFAAFHVPFAYLETPTAPRNEKSALFAEGGACQMSSAWLQLAERLAIAKAPNAGFALEADGGEMCAVGRETDAADGIL